MKAAITEAPAADRDIRLISLRLHLQCQSAEWTDSELEAACECLAGILRHRDAQKDFSGQFRLAVKCDGLTRTLATAVEAIRGYALQLEEQLTELGYCYDGVNALEALRHRMDEDAEVFQRAVR